MRSFALVAFVALIAAIVVAQDSPGMYVDQAGSLVKMEHVPMSGTATRAPHRQRQFFCTAGLENAGRSVRT